MIYQLIISNRATAIFWFSMDDSSEPSIRHQPFHKPVIDFNLEEDGSLWVLLDADWSSHGVWTAGEGDASNCLEVRQWTSNNVPTVSLALLIGY
jgi:tRNA (guanine-N(7)-)-methyltransferase subunit TRM82